MNMRPNCIDNTTKVPTNTAPNLQLSRLYLDIWKRSIKVMDADSAIAIVAVHEAKTVARKNNQPI